MKATTHATRGEVPRTFLELNALHPLMPIKDEVDLDSALEIADRLAVLGRRTSDQDEYLETLSIFLERYEAAHHAIDQGNANPLANLRFLLRQHDMTASDLGKILGSVSSARRC